MALALRRTEPELLIDRFGRRIDYLRVSLTDRCNFRCVYCMPEEGFPATPKEQTLTAEETVRMIRVAASMGVRKIRLTGGEPLLRNDIVDLVKEIANIPSVEDLSCTTNGFLLAEKAEALAEAGLDRINVSLDTLQPEKFRRIARRGDLEPVLNGIQKARNAGLSPVKINCVMMKGENDDELVDFARWTLTDNVHVRFIELMPIRWDLDESLPTIDPFSPHGGKGLLSLRQTSGGELDSAALRKRFLSAADARKSIETELGQLEGADLITNGPARTYRLSGAKSPTPNGNYPPSSINQPLNAIGTIGFISQISDHICSRCNRLRLTHDGFLRACLMSDGELDLKPSLRSNLNDDSIKALYREVVEHKPERHYLLEGQKVLGRGMSQTGG